MVFAERSADRLYLRLARPETPPRRALADEGRESPVMFGDKKDPLSDCPMFGGSPGRNMANTVDRNIPTEWNVQEGQRKNIKWVAKLGSSAFGGPVISGGKVYVGTNSANSNGKAVLMAFNEADGKFLWKIVHDFPDDPLFNEAREQGFA